MSGSAELALSTQIAALITALHEHGVLPIAAVIEQMQHAREMAHPPEWRVTLEQSILRLQILSDALAPFQPSGSGPPSTG